MATTMATQCPIISSKKRMGEMCMLRGIYSDHKCPICGSKYVHREPRGLFCPKHKGQWPTRYVVRFKDLCRRFHNYDEARRFLTGLRFKMDEGSFDSRDYKKDHPMGFMTLAGQFLEVKKAETKYGQYKNLCNYLRKAIDVWGQRNIKEIGYAEIENFLMSLLLSGKTKANIRSSLHSLWSWLKKRRIMQAHQVPEFPDVKNNLGWRRTIDKETQRAVIKEISRIEPFRVYLGIKWLSTYISIRPGELLQVKEGEIFLESGFILITNSRDKEPKPVPLLPEDIELIQSLPRGLPQLPFFRHIRGGKGWRAGQPFGKRYFYKWWKRACANLGI